MFVICYVCVGGLADRLETNTPRLKSELNLTKRLNILFEGHKHTPGLNLKEQHIVCLYIIYLYVCMCVNLYVFMYVLYVNVSMYVCMIYECVYVCVHFLVHIQSPNIFIDCVGLFLLLLDVWTCLSALCLSSSRVCSAGCFHYIYFLCLVRTTSRNF